jgi:hypothetical protein
MTLSCPMTMTDSFMQRLLDRFVPVLLLTVVLFNPVVAQQLMVDSLSSNKDLEFNAISLIF